MKMMMQMITIVPTIPYPNIFDSPYDFSGAVIGINALFGQSTVTFDLARAWPLTRRRTSSRIPVCTRSDRGLRAPFDCGVL
jgi:hypothetical protein